MLALFAALSAAPAHAASLRGVVVEPPGDAPLTAVEVVLRRASDSTVVAHTLTAADGRFRFESLALGRYLLRASLLGHATHTRDDVSLTEQVPDLDLGTLRLAVQALDIAGVTTTTERATAITAPDRNIYLTKDMPAAATGMATDVLRSVAELDVDIEGRVSLRGSGSVNLQFNGRPAPVKGEALAAYLRQFPANRIERIEVIANPSAKFDPEGMAGIVNLVLEDDVDLGLSGSVSLSASQRFSGPGARVAWQEGPLTLFGGVSGRFGNGSSGSSLVRHNLIAPTSYLETSQASEWRSRNGNADVSADFTLSKRVALYGTWNTYLGEHASDGLMHYEVLDASRAATSIYDRIDDGDYDHHSNAFTIGLQHVIEKGRHERVLEYMRSDAPFSNLSLGASRTLLPTGGDEPTSENAFASAQYERSWELEDTRPLGAKAKLEWGYRGSDRRNTKSARLGYMLGDSVVALPLTSTTDDMHHERFHSGFATIGSTFGKLSVQVGARAEAADTRFEVRSTGRTYDNDYRSVFPSANLSWDFGGGRTMRLAYSKRIERPSSYFLNPEVPSPDSLDRFVGNPDLKPKYTHSYSFDASWSGSRGMLRMSPFYRETVDNWDQIKRVDSSGVATTTWLNASSVRYLGASLTASLRQTKRLGGTVSVSLFREQRDAAAVGESFRMSATQWSANGNATFKTTDRLDLQAFLRYSPAQTLAQGRISAFVFSNFSARYKVAESLSASLWLSDPFGLYRYSMETRDAAHVQSSTSTYASRGVSLSANWSWGKPPEQKQRRQSSEQPQQGAGAPGP